MVYKDIVDEQDSVSRHLEEELMKKNININDIKRVRLVDKEGKIYFKDYEDIFLIFTKNDKIKIIEADFHAENEHVFFLLKHGEIYQDQFNREYDELILLSYEINQETINQAKSQGVKVIYKKKL